MAILSSQPFIFEVSTERASRPILISATTSGSFIQRSIRSILASRPITYNGSVSTFNYLPLAPAPTPNPSSAPQLSAANRLSGVRYIRVNASAGNCLTFRELYVFDTTYTNVALLKTATASAQNGTFTAAMGVNGVIDMDNATSGDMTASTKCDGSAWWMVDLGAVSACARPALSVMACCNRLRMTPSLSWQ